MTTLHRTLTATAALLALTACSDKKDAADSKTPEPVIASHLKANQLDGTPSTFLSGNAESPIHWQTWKPSLLEDADKAHRLIVAFVGSSRFPGSAETLAAIESSPALVADFNRYFIPVLIDGEISRDTMLLSAALASEVNESVGFPFMVVLSPDGAPVTWKVLNYRSNEDTLAQVSNALEVIKRLWKDAPDYVRTDSLAKLNRRREHPAKPEPLYESAAERRTKLIEAVQQISSLWDQSSGSLDTLGGLFPAEAMSLLARASRSETISPRLRKRCDAAASAMADQLLASAMIDPLDGGVYSGRIGPSWDFPIPARNCITQAEAVIAMVDLHQFANVPGAVEVATRAAEFAENMFATEDGLFAIRRVLAPSDPTEALWRVDDLELNLDADQFTVWKSMSDFKSLGNLPPEADPARRTFRQNSLRMMKTPEQVAAEVGMPVEDVKKHLEAGRKSLLKARATLHPLPPKDATPSATASFSMIRAYAALFTATGDENWKTKALKLGENCRDAFGQARFLNERPGANPDPMSDSRAFTYALAARASLDLAAITLDDQWTRWATDLMTLLGENFVSQEGDRLSESREGFAIIPFPFEDRSMIFGWSTAGIVRQNLQSFVKTGQPVPPGLRRWQQSLPPIDTVPVIFMDTIAALLAEFDAGTLYLGGEAPPEAIQAATALPLRAFERKIEATQSEAIKFVAPGGEETILPSADAVKDLAGH